MLFFIARRLGNYFCLVVFHYSQDSGIPFPFKSPAGSSTVVDKRCCNARSITWPLVLPAPLNGQRSNCYTNLESASATPLQKLWPLSLGIVRVHCAEQSCHQRWRFLFSRALEPWGGGGLAAPLRKHMPARSPRFHSKENKEGNEETFAERVSTLHGW